MSAGRLSERLTINRPGSTASDGQGGTSSTPVPLTTIWAEPLPLSSGEQLQAESVGSHALYRFKAYVRADVTPAQTIAWTPRWPPGQSAITLQITGVMPLPDRKFMQITAAAVQ